MSSRNWKRVRPTSLRHALELCKDHAKETRNLSVVRIAELMGIADHWAIYKWIQNGRMPAILIRPFEHACGCTFATDYLGASAHKLVIDMPTGRRATEMDLAQLQSAIADTTSTLIRFYAGSADAGETVAQLTNVMSGLAWHRANVAKQSAPELDLFAEEAPE